MEVYPHNLSVLENEYLEYASGRAPQCSEWQPLQAQHSNAFVATVVVPSPVSKKPQSVGAAPFLAGMEPRPMLNDLLMPKDYDEHVAEGPSSPVAVFSGLQFPIDSDDSPQSTDGRFTQWAPKQTA